MKFNIEVEFNLEDFFTSCFRKLKSQYTYVDLEELLMSDIDELLLEYLNVKYGVQASEKAIKDFIKELEKHTQELSVYSEYGHVSIYLYKNKMYIPMGLGDV